ncbi:unnamed protein product [Dibothriocephalus latus]|uniref:Uncharacterized protein n=1 Tax=Dibothriocephalus latus TaxID=60516 RepID=A0A3P7P0S3_DIBLA|nr:unnamed protein product [Dibothriocephalus latus]
MRLTGNREFNHTIESAEFVISSCTKVKFSTSISVDFLSDPLQLFPSYERLFPRPLNRVPESPSSKNAAALSLVELFVSSRMHTGAKTSTPAKWYLKTVPTSRSVSLLLNNLFPQCIRSPTTSTDNCFD